MARLSYILFFVFSFLLLLLLCLALEEKRFNPRCPRFDCGYLGIIGFPFSNRTHPECGLLVVDNCTENVQKIRLGKDGQWFYTTGISQDNMVKLYDRPVEEYKNHCRRDISLKKLSLPISPFLSFDVPYNQSLYECPRNYKPPKYFSSACNNSQHSYIYHSYPGNRKSDLKLRLGIGFGLGGSVMIMTLSFFIWWHRKKQKYIPTYSNSRDCSSDPSPRSEQEVGGAYFGIPIFSYAELAKATNNFSHERGLGDGGFGSVYYAKIRDGREVAIKRLYEHNYRRVEQFMNEVEILTRLRHKNLVSLYGCTSPHCQQGLLLVYEYVPNGTVGDHLHGDLVKPGSLTWPIRMKIAIETASALAYLHASDIIHRDVKTNNILLDNNFCVKVADFGLSRLFPVDVTHVSTAPHGSPGYVDPEYYQCYQLTDRSDVYSFGVVLIELISSMPAVDLNRHRHEINLANLAVNRIKKGAFEELVDPLLGYQSDEEVKRMTTAVAELAFLCLQQNKEVRPPMDVVLEELKRIESGEWKLEDVIEEKDNIDELQSMQRPQSPPDCDDLALLKHIRVPSSPISVTAKWVSAHTTPNVSS
ncbi:LEAF RUST 10 DISEASE-RESISTANCE LOCUS RECEPTOR-LIKE PROTEIN KINASE-like 1.1 isoform X2 [Pistacia vera]|uniref:LEAF RUST 10 DISEASE-RESISTANCE LOCUS RECEPTOR-LIKE PROTEIN KINASE-like 1.1 isoform X2 n=1 Tax=Pistacia vera TaxID=55513 RepID=UPI00126331E0|nr:LEAF RUST 10 DISEASE-RESISTANCE LOCUS RECEPTOR-LIKE PROTEIN KINASE-like 1.1 isoform X2 [Pistacia vera]